MRRHEVQGVAIPAIDISKIGVADTDGILQHGCKHRLKIAGELLMTCSTSDVAVCCSIASSRSRVRRSSSSCSSAIEELRRRTAPGAPPRFDVTAWRARVLGGFPPAVERRFTAFPKGSRQGVVSP